MKNWQKTILTVLLIGIIAICSVLIANKLFGWMRLDLTEHGLYSLSEGTKNILKDLPQELRLKLYYSRAAALKGPEQIRYYNNYFLYVRELLKEYVSLSDGKLRLTVIDPRPFTEDEEDAMRKGLQKFNITDTETFFFGLVASSELGKDEIISFFEPDRQEFVEYDISRVIYRVTQQTKNKIGVLSPLPVMGEDLSPTVMRMRQMQGQQPQRPWNIITHLRETYDVVQVDVDAEEITKDINYLLVIHPKKLSQATLYAIDQYVMRGGKLIVFQDPFSFMDQPPMGQQNPQLMMSWQSSSNLNSLLTRWGVTLEDEMIAADSSMAITAQLSRAAPPEPIPTFLQISDENVNKDQIIAANLHDIKALYAGSLVINKEADTKVEPLLFATDDSGIWKPKVPMAIRAPSSAEILQEMAPKDEPVMLACQITGKLKSNFPEGRPDNDSIEENEVDQSDQKPEHLVESREDAVVVVVADVDILSDMLAYQNAFFGITQVGDNASLLLNAVDVLAGSSDLISIRSRGRFKRPFEVIDAIEEKADKDTTAKVEEINARIASYQERLEQLDEQVNTQNVKVLQNEALSERQNIQAEIRKAQRQLRQLNADKRASIESLGTLLQTLNMLLAPLVVLIIAISLWVTRLKKAKVYAQRRTQE